MPIIMGLGKIIPIKLIYQTRLQVLLTKEFCCFCKQLSG